jgi:hypothetical protein
VIPPAAHLLDFVPSWLFGTVWYLGTLGAMELGWRAGTRQRRRAEQTIDGPVGNAAAAILGLLAFIMAFTFGFAASRYDSRMELLLDEVDAIRTASTRAGLLQEPHKTPSAAVVLTLGFSAFIVLIHELDRPLHGWIRVSQQPMLQLHQEIHEGSP